MAWQGVVVCVVLFLTVAYGQYTPSTACLQCICEVEGCEKKVGTCGFDVYSESCGPFQIKKPYWEDCNRPGGDFHSCTKQMVCSKTCVNSYLSRYASHCMGGGAPTCETFARVHNGGPSGCRNPHTLPYWKKVQACYHRKAAVYLSYRYHQRGSIQ